MEIYLEFLSLRGIWMKLFKIGWSVVSGTIKYCIILKLEAYVIQPLTFIYDLRDISIIRLCFHLNHCQFPLTHTRFEETQFNAILYSI